MEWLNELRDSASAMVRALDRDLETVKGNIREEFRGVLGVPDRSADRAGGDDRERLPENISTWSEQIEWLAYNLWEKRGRPIGSPEVDWFRAEKFLQERSNMIESYGFVTPSFDLGHLLS